MVEAMITAIETPAAVGVLEFLMTKDETLRGKEKGEAMRILVEEIISDSNNTHRPATVCFMKKCYDHGLRVVGHRVFAVSCLNLAHIWAIEFS